MAFSEVQRVRARKKITLPSGDTIYIPVIISLTVKDQNGQETEHHYLNTTQALNREIHVDHLTASFVDADGNPTSDPGTAVGTETIDVERIDTWIGLDVTEQGQESKFLLDNTTGGDTHPPRFTTHQKTHVYRYYQNPTSPDDGGTWVDSELIDEISVVDQNGQEWQYFLDNPINADTRGGDFSGQASPDDPDISDTPDLDPPYRTDPFQNIINFNSTNYFVAYANFNMGNAYSLPVIVGAGPGYEPADPVTYIEFLLLGFSLWRNVGDATNPSTVWTKDSTSKLHFPGTAGPFQHQDEVIPVNGASFTTGSYAGPPWQDLDEGGGQQVLHSAWHWKPNNIAPNTFTYVGTDTLHSGPSGYHICPTGNTTWIFPTLGSTGGDVVDNQNRAILAPAKPGGGPNTPFVSELSVSQQIFGVDNVTGAFPSPGLNYHWAIVDDSTFDVSGYTVVNNGTTYMPVGVQVDTGRPGDVATGGSYLGGLVDGGSVVAILFAAAGTTLP